MAKRTTPSYKYLDENRELFWHIFSEMRPWNEIIRECHDHYLYRTPYYNHGYPVLKKNKHFIRELSEKIKEVCNYSPRSNLQAQVMFNMWDIYSNAKGDINAKN